MTLTRSQIKEQCKNCINRFGDKLKFVDIDGKFFCAFRDGNKVTNISNIESCEKELGENEVLNAIISGYILDNKNIFNPLDY